MTSLIILLAGILLITVPTFLRAEDGSCLKCNGENECKNPIDQKCEGTKNCKTVVSFKDSKIVGRDCAESLANITGGCFLDVKDQSKNSINCYCSGVKCNNNNLDHFKTALEKIIFTCYKCSDKEKCKDPEKEKAVNCENARACESVYEVKEKKVVGRDCVEKVEDVKPNCNADPKNSNRRKCQCTGKLCNKLTVEQLIKEDSKSQKNKTEPAKPKNSADRQASMSRTFSMVSLGVVLAFLFKLPNKV